jgi:hypothetical protein
VANFEHRGVLKLWIERPLRFKIKDCYTLSTMANGLSEREKAELRYEVLKDALEYSQHIENNYSNKFVEMQMQIASIVVGLVGGAALLGGGFQGPILVYIIGTALLIISLLSGIVAIACVRSFWNQTMRAHRKVYNVWRGFLLDGGNYGQAEKDAKQIAGSNNILESPRWPYHVQTACLAIGLLILGGAVIATLLPLLETA